MTQGTFCITRPKVGTADRHAAAVGMLIDQLMHVQVTTGLLWLGLVASMQLIHHCVKLCMTDAELQYRFSSAKRSCSGMEYVGQIFHHRAVHPTMHKLCIALLVDVY